MPPRFILFARRYSRLCKNRPAIFAEIGILHEVSAESVMASALLLRLSDVQEQRRRLPVDIQRAPPKNKILYRV